MLQRIQVFGAWGTSFFGFPKICEVEGHIHGECLPGPKVGFWSKSGEFINKSGVKWRNVEIKSIYLSCIK